ncbi:uncharacterized protein LOC128398233 [Panonychus citri]|uniref:uncharacterized protein LOC128398233 n=1 Tax=Panonychus citri TaxID=50023 RepID=UPI002307AFED|nr:uncharacterized protein LOC128398233 [Panonychus citri]
MSSLSSSQSISDLDKSSNLYKFGRYFLIGLAITTIILDSHKMINEYNRSHIQLTSSLSTFNVINYYSASIITHIVGLGAAIEHEIWLTVTCRLVSALIYQINLNTKSTDLPSDPKELEKMVRKKIKKNPDLLNQIKRKPFSWVDMIKNFMVTF